MGENKVKPENMIKGKTLSNLNNTSDIEVQNVNKNDAIRIRLLILDLIAAICGIATLKSRQNSTINLVQKFFFGCSIFLISYAFTLHSYFILVSGFSALHLARFIYNLMAFKVMIDAQVDGHKLDHYFELLLVQLIPKYGNKIRLVQVMNIATYLIITALNLTILICGLISASNGYDDFELLLHGSKNITKNKLFMLLTGLNMSSIWTNSLISTFIYVRLQIALEFLGEKCENEFPIMIENGQLHLIRSQCELFNQVRTVANSVMGFVPFSLFVAKWIFFVFGVSMIILNRDKFTSAKIYYLVVFMVITISMMLLKTVFSAHYANLKMQNARKIAAGLLNLPSNTVSSTEVNQLNMYLIHEPIVPAMVWHFFEIHPSLILISYNSMMTFSVMAMSTLSVFVAS